MGDLTRRYEICGAGETGVGEKPDWLSFITPEHRLEADALWNDVYTGGLATKTAEWQFVNGRWGMSFQLRFPTPPAVYYALETEECRLHRDKELTKQLSFACSG